MARHLARRGAMDAPVNPDFEVKAISTGVFHASKGGGIVDVISMTEVSAKAFGNEVT